MKFLLDASIPRSFKKKLIELGHDVIDVRDIYPPRTSNGKIIDKAKEDTRILISKDYDFDDENLYPLGTHPGIIILKTGALKSDEIWELLYNFLIIKTEKDLSGNISVIEKNL